MSFAIAEKQTYKVVLKNAFSVYTVDELPACEKSVNIAALFSCELSSGGSQPLSCCSLFYPLMLCYYVSDLFGLGLSIYSGLFALVELSSTL